ncbi:right-handed parallel beta-helix repeat-containing protein [Salmonella enterica]|nr:phage tail protein [Salmonella enterica subsp. enterica serovar Anatum]EDA0724028.1 phage tail protein [Salmonella enterica]EJF6251993.1 right-handed parallel beta-helix repeat-containing protein [Salmonella enterica]EJR3771693.1 right-handed parallel beta-helix repeat-containing protein [Salmonella enterica subsp. enterica serovar Alachua]EJZ4317128.1 right-handed parallel beta-helix repeat-containing protein [Salmonella enterica subsp. enterica serovar Alachua]
MTDITANVVVSNPRPIFTESRSFKAVANGKIYIGQIDTDPVNPANQIPVYIENEDGSHVQIAQPLIINAAGKIVYNGQLVKIVTVQGHSMAIYDAYGSQVDYIANVLKYDPDQLRQELAGPNGYLLIPSMDQHIKIQQWREEGDIRGWGAIDGEFNDAAVSAALDSESPSVKLGGVGFVSKLRSPINHKSNKVMHSGSLNFQFDGGTQQEKSGILMANISNAKVIDVDITGTLDGGIRGYGGSNIVIDGVNVHDIGVSTLSGECGMGIWFGDYAHYENQTDGLLIQNCRINNIGGVGIMRGDGIGVYNAKNFTIRNNNITTVNRMGISAGSDCLYFKIHGNYIGDILLAGIDIEPDAHYTASNFKIYNNTIIGFASRFVTATGGVGQLFGIDIHANTSYGKVYKNILAAGQYGTEAFHIGNHADEIEITDNDLIGGAVVIPLFIKTFDGSGSKHIKINRNRAKGTCKSFALIAMSEDVYISENVFSGNSSTDSYFLNVATTLGLNVDYNRSSNTTNFIKSGDAGNTSNVKVTNNNAYTLSDGIDMLTSGYLAGFIASGNTILCPASNKGISLEVTGSGSISDLRLRGNIIYNATTKIYVSPAATGWDMLTKNTRFDLSGVQNGTQLFELSRNRVTQFLNNAWYDG